MPEFRPRPDAVEAAHRAISEVAESEHDPHLLRAVRARAASTRDSFLNSSGVGRFCGGAHRTACGHVRARQPQPVGTGDALWLIGEAGTPQRCKEPVA